MKIGKKSLSLLLAVALTLAMTTEASAASVSTNTRHAISLSQKQEVISTLQKLNEYRANKLLQKASQKAKYSSGKYEEDSSELSLENKLKSLGVEELTTDEVKARFGKSPETASDVITPPSSSHIRWYSINYTITEDGTTYDLQDLYAQGLDGDSDLAEGANGVTLYSGSQIAINSGLTLASIYAEKLIGLVPIVQWLPYELLFSNNSNVTNNSHVITHRSLSTICFTYVKRDGESDDYQCLCFITNMVSVHTAHTLAGYRNGEGYTKSTDTNTTMYSDNYASGDKAVDNYTGASYQQESFISYYTYYGTDQSESLTYYVINPNFPAQIY